MQKLALVESSEWIRHMPFNVAKMRRRVIGAMGSIGLDVGGTCVLGWNGRAL